MKKYFMYACILACAFPTVSMAVTPESLAPLHKKALKDAHESGNNFVIDAVAAHIKQQLPNQASDVDAYLTIVAQKKSEAERQKKALIASTKTSKFSGSVDVGASVSTGNTQERDLNANTELTYKTGDISNTVKLTARASSDDGATTSEEYAVNNKTKYTLTSKSYSFLELEYVKDRFSGYDYRASELLGMGYKWIDTDAFKLATEASAGARQSNTVDDEQTSSMLGKFGVETEWQITDNLSVENETSTSLASDALITISDTSLKNKLSESLYLKLNHNFQHIDDVPENTKNIDTLTTLGVGYEF